MIYPPSSASFSTQGIGEKYDSVRRDLKTLLGDPTVTDEVLLRQVIKTTREESERKRRHGRSSAMKVSHAHAASSESKEKTKDNVEVNQINSDPTLQRLSAQVEALTQAMENLKAMTAHLAAPEELKIPTREKTPKRKKELSELCIPRHFEL
ncbi:hypothetical protein XENOCAPTIV_012774 [Xenoophorus captivus]|uniref:Uncharacterized protein n=1 Tax=Xenoophorus captivus TaxID=1517983 RepID=A0ABV0R8E9_9TELE